MPSHNVANLLAAPAMPVSSTGPQTLPKALILSAAVPETGLAGSLLLYRLFRHYPADRLLAVGPATRSGSDLLACDYRVLNSAPSARLDLTRFAGLKRSLESIGLMGRIPLARIDALVGSFAPDVVVCVMEQRDYTDAAHRFCRSRRLPLVLIVHDRVESFDLVYGPFRRAQLRRNAATYQFASARLCVSPEMVADLAMAYGAPGTVLYPNRSELLMPRAREESGQLKVTQVLTVGYAGSLAYGYGDRIREVMPRLAAAGVCLRLYSRDGSGNAIDGVIHAGVCASPEEAWNKVQAECDVVWLPYGYARHYEALYSTHFPSKLTEYMALGMPVLVSGPAYATGVKWGIKHPDAAVTVTDASVESLIAAVTRLREDADLRVRLAGGTAAANADFDPALIRAQFVQTLRDVSRVSQGAAPSTALNDR